MAARVGGTGWGLRMRGGGVRRSLGKGGRGWVGAPGGGGEGRGAFTEGIYGSSMEEEVKGVEGGRRGMKGVGGLPLPPSLSIFPSVRPSVCLSVCPSVCQ